MSRVGLQPILIPEGVNVSIDGKNVEAKGPKGNLSYVVPRILDVTISDSKVIVASRGKTKEDNAMHGTVRAEIANIIKGVNEGFFKKLELVGTGYRAEVNGDKLVLTVGYSHPVEIKAPENTSFKVEKTTITVEGINKYVVGQTAAKIRDVRPPEPYKGKGIRYQDEVVRRKPGKAAAKAQVA